MTKPKKTVKKTTKKVAEKNKEVELNAEKILDAVLGIAEPTNDDEYKPEVNHTGAPKNFFIRCPKCRWARTSTGLKDDVADLYEISPGCTTCGKWRKFKCPKCGMPATMQRIKGN